MLTFTDTGAAIGPAEIVDVNRADAAVWVRRRGADDDSPQRAQVAIPWCDSLCPRATVLVASGAEDELYVIGLLESPTASPPRRIETTDGVTALAKRSGDAETLQVISETGELLFEYDATNRRSRVRLPGGDVQFVAPDGSIDLIASGGIRLHSEQTVDIAGELGVRLEAGQPLGATSSLALGSHDARLAGPRVGITTSQLEVAAVESRFTGRQLLARITRTRLVTETLEAVFGTVVQKAKNVFRRVAGLDELHVKNARTLVEDTMHVNGGQLNLKADGDVRINGEQIHLG